MNPDVQILRALRSRPGDLRSIPDLEQGIARLRAAGYQIDPRADGAYHLQAAPALLIADDIRASINPSAVVGREIVVFRETSSTNDLAAQAGRDGIAEGLVIFAESQQTGRGRLGRQWSSPPGLGLWFSVLLRPTAPVTRWAELTFCAALAVAETAELFTGTAARIKWPNDVLLDGRKVAGILLESHAEPNPYLVMGIGLNVLHAPADFPVDLRERATSLKMAGPLPDRREVAAALLNTLDEHYQHWPANYATTQVEYQKRGCSY